MINAGIWAVVLIAGSAASAPARAVEFEAQAEGALETVRALRAEQKSSRETELVNAFWALNGELGALTHEASPLPNRIWDIGRRLSDPRDPGLRRDMESALRTLRMIHERLFYVAQAQERLERAIPGPMIALSAVAMDQVRLGQNLVSKLRLSADEAEKTIPRLRAAGFAAEAKSMEEKLGDLGPLSARCHARAWDMLHKVQGSR